MFCSLAMNSTWNACGCFSWLIQQDLDKVTEHWNSHYIRKSRYDTISGIPNILYMLPEYNGKQDCLVPLENQDIEEMKAHCELEDQTNTIYTEYFESVMDELALQCPVNETEALNLFQHFVDLQG